MRRARARPLVAALATLACASGLVVGVGASAPAMGEECPTDPRQVEEKPETPGMSPLAADLDYSALRAAVPSTGDVSVAVLDTGILPGDGRLALAPGAQPFGVSADIESTHGTEVAGVIGASDTDSESALGVAPGVRLLDLQVADAPVVPEDSDQLRPATAETIAAALQWVAQNAPAQGIKVVNVSLGVAADTNGVIEAQVQALDALGVLVVAAQADRDEDAEEPTPGADPEPEAPVYPAAIDLPNVIAVGATPAIGGAATGTNQPSERTDVVAPAEAYTVAPLQGTCEVADSTAYAAAAVSGLAALMFAYDPSWNARQVRTRIIETAGGVTDASNPYAGGGSIQPLEALTRDLDINAEGELLRSTSVPREPVEAAPPTMPDDPLSASRSDFLWWGLIGGAAVVLALVLRPALQRIRSGR